MTELLHVRPSYVFDGDRMFADAHRLVRNAIAIARILDLPFGVVEAAAKAVERVENSTDDDERRYDANEVRVITELVASLAIALDEALDPEQRPVGMRGQAIVREALLPQALASGEIDRMRVFELDAEGRVSTVYPRMSLFDIREQLPQLAAFLREAAQIDAQIAVVE